MNLCHFAKQQQCKGKHTLRKVLFPADTPNHTPIHNPAASRAAA
jgi:hypothetical protein